MCEDEDAEGCGGDSPGASSDRSLRSSRASFSSATTTATTAAAAHVSTSRVKVVVRVRPVDASVKTCVSTHKVSDGATSAAQVQLHDPSRDVQPFAVNVDAALPPSAGQEDVFHVVGWPMVDHCMDGFNSTIFAYGQTGSGKTHTMMGDLLPPDERGGGADLNAGLIPRVFARLFEAMGEAAVAGRQRNVLVECSFLEIYNEEVTDLLNPSSTNLQIRDGDKNRGTYVQGLSAHRVVCLEDVLRLIGVGSEHRKIASTELNERSSRSHSVFTATISWEKAAGKDDQAAGAGAGAAAGKRVVSRLNLVDLAGSERVGKSGATGEQLVEARSINKSLSVLGRVISRLVEKQEREERAERAGDASTTTTHVPYRDSKLTFLLQESLGGNSKTAVVATVTPSVCSAGETYCTLAFAAGAKKLTCRAVVNEKKDRSGGLVSEEVIKELNALREENARLRVELEEGRVEAEMAVGEALARRSADDDRFLKDQQERVEALERIEALERELEQTRMLFDQNSQVIGMLRAEQSVVQRELVEAKATALRATQEASTLRASNVNLSNAFEALEEENSRLQSAMDNLQDQFVHENGELEQAKTDMAIEIERLASEAELEAGSLREKLDEVNAARKKELSEMQTKLMLLEKDLAHSNDKASSVGKLRDDAAAFKAAADSSKVEIKMLKEKMAEAKEEFNAERAKMREDLDAARVGERQMADALASAGLEKQQLVAELVALRADRERDSKEHESAVEGLENRINVERASVAKYKRMVGEISKLVDWAQSNQAGSAAAAAAVLAASNENAVIKPSPAAQAALRVARMSLSAGGSVASHHVLRDASI